MAEIGKRLNDLEDMLGVDPLKLKSLTVEIWGTYESGETKLLETWDLDTDPASLQWLNDTYKHELKKIKEGVNHENR